MGPHPRRRPSPSPSAPHPNRLIADKTEKYVPPPEVAAWTQSGPKDEELVCWFTPGSGQGPGHADKAPHSINDRRAVVPELPKRH